MLSVSEVNEKAKALLETTFAGIEVEGEISKFSEQSISKHWYFTIKDENSALNCAMFRFANQKLNFTPKIGMRVVLTGKLTIYPATGAYQIQVTQMREAGAGELEMRFNALKEKLSGEGLFDASRKKPLPKFPRHIALITSAGSAACADMLRVANDRFPMLKIDIYNSLVQGTSAPSSIISALRRADSAGYDAIIIARGGGSKEDLWCFNDEMLAREIYAAQTPIISAVGHEIDFSISDFVADHRSLTPTAAMVDLLPEISTLYQNLDGAENCLKKFINEKIANLQNELKMRYFELKSKSVDTKITQNLLNLQNLEIKFKNTINAKFANLTHQIELKNEILKQKASYFELTKDLVQIQKDGKKISLEELQSGDKIAIVSQNAKKVAQILD
ncbi:MULTISPECIES: exodeoxyribonuclease VII large subunit [unclassified Campylobacter]|uniref:exodeoxyribonuclease VII large subunit n=1 Tax=unclassified Campylobacter TaxID=2593542 RepID=UPI0022E9DB49|nr:MULTISPECIES: exodeoxyribonuclease VII large subunit [unclassified Campylobacter]MDA3043722.1 exodeoxyribonuclease VII large subunit [Campylobacter sp. JMF_09 ED2]MDA3045327.1 exodeoxyribonuclease VII large subunit [Campylobacter sp. JMF_07 ED4]MDA3064513.1 exodeoxyribonuclease VII large subunit [Campylobacter sp. JMF_11 EL3]MDA3072206.1 exodeoxyribonuclease VII large subunit [Campylobacter sp. VBCF_03 NA9]MDA3075589.1 exodeoxyribonuclease VII large subunit [Campylobacter sp. JMF_05 ED3]